MPAFFARADLILCRSGASTVAEVTAAGKPAVFVPFPRAADDHQRVNAQALERAGAADVLVKTKVDEMGVVENGGGIVFRPAPVAINGLAVRAPPHPDGARQVAG